MTTHPRALPDSALARDTFAGELTRERVADGITGIEKAAGASRWGS